MSNEYTEQETTAPRVSNGPTESDRELRDLLTLHLVPGLGPKLTAALLEPRLQTQ